MVDVGSVVAVLVESELGGAGAEANDLSQGDPNDFFDFFLDFPQGQLNLTKGVSSSSDPTQVVLDNNPAAGTNGYADSSIVLVNTTPAVILSDHRGREYFLSGRQPEFSIRQM